jgi:hypothetical protein
MWAAAIECEGAGVFSLLRAQRAKTDDAPWAGLISSYPKERVW